MKDFEYVYKMLKRAESRKRKAIKDNDHTKHIAYSYVVKNLKIVLDLNEKFTGKNRIRKLNKINDELLSN